MSCTFCEIARGERDAYKVYEDDDTLVILDIYPVSKGHLLVIPKEHHEAIEDMPATLLKKVWLVASAMAKLYREELKAPGVNVLNNSGRAAGQIIFHFHVHVIPRWEGQEIGKHTRHHLQDDEARDVMASVKPFASKYVSELLSSSMK